MSSGDVFDVIFAGYGHDIKIEILNNKENLSEPEILTKIEELRKELILIEQFREERRRLREERSSQALGR